jgi:hypothetical protein
MGEADQVSKSPAQPLLGRPIYIGATVLLPKGYDEHPGVLYPSVYIQGHYSLAAPFNFSTQFNPNEKSWAPGGPKPSPAT